MLLDFDTNSMADYRKFLKLKTLPTYSWKGTSAVVPDEYASLLEVAAVPSIDEPIELSPSLYDYQAGIAPLAIRKKKFAVFVDPGWGKTNIMLEFSRHAWRCLRKSGKKVLIVSPLMVIDQTLSESHRFYPELPIEQVNAADLQQWLLTPGDAIGITNYEAIREGLDRGLLGALVMDESSLIKSAYGAWGTRLIELGRGLEWKLALTGTPAPNDRVEYANHAIFCDHVKTVNEFYARYFVNKGQTQNRWELKPHAVKPFYRDLSHWCIFMSNPATYGWKDNCGEIPPINVHIEHIELTDQQREISQKMTGGLFVAGIGGIGQRGKMSQLAKGRHAGSDVTTNKPAYIRGLVDSWPDESTIIWCYHNDEQDAMERLFPDAASIRGDTPHEKRKILLSEFQSGKRRVLISKGKCIGFGLNLQIATRHIFNGLKDSYEDFWQCCKRSNRVGSTRPLNVHIPITEIEEPMVATVMEKAKRVQQDTEEQEKLFKQQRLVV